MAMLVNNTTAQDYYLGPLHIPANASGFSIDVSSDTSLYMTDDSVADALNYLVANGKITVVSGAPSPFPRPTGTPGLLHGDGSPEGLVFASQGTLYIRRDQPKVYQKSSLVHLNTGWNVVGEWVESSFKAGAYETLERFQCADDLNPLSTGVLTLIAIDLPEGFNVQNISFVSGGTAAGTPTNQWFALYDQNLNKLAVTADDTTNAWAADTKKTLALSSAYRTTYAGLHYLGIMVKATTVPTLAGKYARTSILGLTPKLEGQSTSGLTNPASAPATAAALSVGGGFPYGYVS